MDNIMIHEKRLPKTKKRIAAEEISSAAIRSYSILNSATHIVRNKFKILSNNILTSILPCQKIHLT